jgi:hypothetical protein
MNIELEITDPRGVHNRGGRLEPGARICLDQHDGRAKAWLRFGQARVAGAEKAPGPAAAAPEAETPEAPVAAEPEEQPKSPRRKRGGKKRGE